MSLDLSPESWILRDVYIESNLRKLDSIRLSHIYQKPLIQVEVTASHPTILPHYRRGGWINQMYGQTELESSPVPLNKRKILRLPNYGEGGYSVQFRPVGIYLVSYSLKVWEYGLDISQYDPDYEFEEFSNFVEDSQEYGGITDAGYK